MTPEQAVFLSQFLLPQIEQEVKTTYRVLAAVPNDKSSYTPHDTCMNALTLAQHIGVADVMFLEGIVKGEFTGPDEKAFAFANASEVAEAYQKKVPALLEQVKSLSPEQLSKVLKFYVFELPTVAFLEFMQKHMVHHRGQLSAYLRPMGAKVPGIYGGSADEPFTAKAEA